MILLSQYFYINSLSLDVPFTCLLLNTIYKTYRNFLVSALCLVIATGTMAQEADVSGSWKGTYSFLGKRYATSFQLQQDGNVLTGYTETLPEDPEKANRYTLEGTIKGNKVVLFGKEFVKKGDSGCRAKFTFQLISAGDQMILDGKWGPNLKYKGCALGATGKVNVQKVSKPEVLASVRNGDGNPVEGTKKADDAYTRELVKGLRKRNYHALVIGIDQYSDPSINSLDNPINDGKNLIAALSTHYTFGDSNIYFLQNPTRAEILDEFEKLTGELGERDNLLIFYAGHGYWDEQFQQGYWLPSDASQNSKANWISNATIRDYIRAINSKHTLLIADACFSGGLLKSRGIGKAMLSVYKMPSRKAITSGTLTEVPDESVFIKYLIKYLNNNEELLMSADQLFYNIKVSVMNNSPNSQVPQYGPIHQANDEGGEFVFVQNEK